MYQLLKTAAAASILLLTTGQSYAEATSANGGALEGDGSWQIMIQDRVSIPNGHTASPDIHFATPVQATALRVVMGDEYNRCGAVTEAVEVARSEDQKVYDTYYPDVNGVITLVQPGVVWLKLHAYNPYLLNANCAREVSFYVEGNGGETSQYRYMGVLSYTGGFVNQMKVAVDSGVKIRRFAVRIPTFCSSVEILEAGTITEGHYDVANLVDNQANIFEVNSGAGSRAGAIAVSLNGPHDVNCDIPIYAIGE